MGDALWTIDTTLRHKGFQHVRPLAVYKGRIPVHGRKVQVEIDVPDVTFARLPSVRLIDREAIPLRQIAHIGGDREICYVGDGGLPLDMYDPGGSVLRVLAEAQAALEQSFGGRAAAEFERELSSYWTGSVSLFAVPPNGRGPAIVSADVIPANDHPDAGLVVVPRGAWQARKPEFRLPATVLQFDRNLTLTERYPPNTLAEAMEYINAQRSPPIGWKEAVLKAAANLTWVFLQGPNAIMGWAAQLPRQVAFLRVAKGIRPQFYERAVRNAVTTIELDRKVAAEADLRSIVERNLYGQKTLADMDVAVVGCGTIGGYLARMLLQSGAGCGGKLHVYDTDVLGPGNLGRHLLGFDDLGRPKALALSEELQKFHPDVEVIPHGADATKEWSVLSSMDLIVDATGDPNVATALNDCLLKSRARTAEGPALLHCWVFGNGVAAQSYLNLHDGHACYRCLKTGFDGEWRFNPLKDRKAPPVHAPARCSATGYVPFGVDAPVAAAGLAIRAALDWAAGKPGKRMRTTILDHSAGRDKVEWTSPAPLKGCPACGS